ncbi:MAG: histidine kinase dimerization/phosphoacceptor domain -containing protein [Balneolaceae bacterium]
MAMLTVSQTYKGLFFVSVTSLLLYVLIKSATSQMEERNRKIDALLKSEKVKSHKIGESMKRLQLVLVNAPSPICFLEGDDHTYTFVNEAYKQMIGDRDLVGKPVSEAVPEIQSQGFIEILDKVYQTGEMYLGKEVPMVIKKEGERTVLYRDFIYMPLRDDEDRIYGIFVQANDITRLIRANRELEDLLADKEILLQEVHHRVKNNLAVVIGLIELQADHFKESEIIKHLRHTQSRIHTIADIHELLYTKGGLKNIPLEELIHILAETIFRIIDGDNVPACRIEVEPHSLNINQAIPLGLIFNELFSFLAGKLENNDRTVVIRSDYSEKPMVEIQIEISDLNCTRFENQFLDTDTFEGVLTSIFLQQLKAESRIQEAGSGLEFCIRFESIVRRGSAGNISVRSE